MPLPENLVTITVTGTFLDSTGTPLSGSLSFTPNPELVDPGSAIMYSATQEVTLDDNGHFTVTLICTDNANLVPVGWYYIVVENVRSLRSYPIYLPHTLGATVDLSSLTPIPTLTGAIATVPAGAIAPGYGGVAYSQTWTGTNVYDGPAVFDGSVTFGNTITAPGGSLVPSDWLNVKTYGAKGDGATNDTADIQDTLNACPPGGTVYLPAGVYRTSAPLIQRPYTTVIGAHGNGQYQDGGASPYSSIKPLASFSGAAVWKILDGNLGGYNAPTILAAPNTGGYQVVSAEYTITGLSIDGSALPAGEVIGIQALGQIQNIYLDNVDVQQVTGHGIDFDFNEAVTEGPQAPFACHFRRVAVQAAGGTGIVLNNTTDSTFVDCYVLGCTSFGWWVHGCANSLLVACRGEWSGQQGFDVGLDGAQMQMVGCSTDRNTEDGILITTSGSTPGTVVLTGCTLNRDGRNGAAGGGGYAGLNVDNATCRVLASDLVVIPGHDDDGSGTLSPEYGVSVTSAAYVSIASGALNGATAAWNDGGSNTTLVRGPNVLEATGTGIAGSYPGMELTRSGATINGTLNVTGSTTLAGANMGGDKVTNIANGTASSDGAAYGQIPTSLPPNGAAGGDLTGSTYPNPVLSATANVLSIIHAQRLDQMAAPTSAVGLNSQKITSVANGTASNDGAAFGQIPLIDSTAGDIKSLGPQAAGSTGKVADAGHVHPYSSTVTTSPVSISGTTAATLASAGPTIAASGSYTGMAFLFDIFGTVTTTADTQTLTLIVYLGGVSGTALLTMSGMNPNSSGTVTNAPFHSHGLVEFESATSVAVTAMVEMNFFFTAMNDALNDTVSLSTAKQLVAGITPSASAMSFSLISIWQQLN